MKPARNHVHTRALILGAVLAAFAQSVAHADSGRLMPRNVPQAYTQECAACHTAYAPALLPVPSWQRIMSGLDKHYGTDASLDPATVEQLSSWLQSNAGGYRRVTEAPPEDRITRSTWFVREHRDLDPAVWKHASVKSAANCAACHTGADRGDFDDDSIRIPSGLDARLRRGFSD
jgi:mono/diheme cytochrome c family protein